MKKIKKWTLLNETDLSPSPWFPLFKHKVKLPNGRIIDDYYISKVGDVSMIVALTKNREMVFVRQYKHGADDIIIELPAGRILNGNTPEQTAILELEEETGYVAENISYLGYMYAEPSKDTQKTHGFLVKDVYIKKKQKLDQTEEIEVILVSLDDVDDMIKRGEIYATDTVAVLRLAQLKYPEIFG